MVLRKKRNFKGLALPSDGPDEAKTPSNMAIPSDAAGLGSIGLDTAGGATFLYEKQGYTNAAVASLEIGVEFRLDLRSEDLQHLQEMGSGASGMVNQVLHIPTKTIMAMKTIRIDANIRQQVLKELQILHECNSPYIVSFYGAFATGNDIRICMESFDHIYKKHGPIPVDVLGKLTYSVLMGLTYLYEEHRIMHRDIKPSNILVNSSGYIKICDFGISKEMVNSIANTFVGTAAYMSPERMEGSSYTVKSDVWSLGTALMELAIGQYPFRPEGEAMSIFEMLDFITKEELPPLPQEFPEDLRDLVNQCLRRDPVQRPTPKELLNHPFVERYSAEKVDIAKWAKTLTNQ
ncbi:MAP kinase kinase (MEK) [Mycoemilia scoparia]|uniref:MAP kinase kinase (MEK) n=1 Tax=Mycoemilia scoparia TaxID=417184 RepID=A0A9W7ZWU6_9FUNG|nr:MAP kinase kinase (MEK) [Mycoemilia scoparia]